MNTKRWFDISLFLLASATGFAAEAINPCVGTLLNLVDRPSVADNACVPGLNHAILELGYQHQQNTLQNYPEATIRLGLTPRSEFFTVLPNYFKSAKFSQSGFSSAAIGFKQIVILGQQHLTTLEGAVVLPETGIWGNQSLGGIVNAIYSDNMTSKLNFTAMMGISYLAGSQAKKAHYATHFNPIINLQYALSEKFNGYGELFGQTQPGSMGADVGMLYLVKPNVVVDASLGQHLTGNQGDFKRYIGIGFSTSY